ncbi:MAG: iron-sulfur cluster assembly scaffold protein [Limnochordaceae bacterium]|nr:iron-sulfur cluster assembly scaffold protein [Limnochordaceae bacterium]
MSAVTPGEGCTTHGIPVAGKLDPEARLQLVVDHFQNPRHFGALPEATVVLPGGNPGCGDVVVMYLRAEGERLVDVKYEGQGCTVSQAAASLLLEHLHATGLDPDAILAMDYHFMEELLGDDLVRARPRCATLALGTLKSAIQAWRRKLRAGTHQG